VFSEGIQLQKGEITWLSALSWTSCSVRKEQR
jgi:hypothetical protein